MELKDWCKAERGRASRLAKAAGIPRSFLSQILAGKRPMPPVYALTIETETGGKVTRQEMCQGWRSIWPDLKAPKPTVIRSKRAVKEGA